MTEPAAVTAAKQRLEEPFTVAALQGHAQSKLRPECERMLGFVRCWDRAWAEEYERRLLPAEAEEAA